MKCKICNKVCSNINGLAKHLSYLHKTNILDYYVKYENFKIPKCVICGNNTNIASGITFRKTCGKRSCISSLGKKFHHSDEMKKNLSVKRKEYLQKNKNNHNWSKFHKKETQPEINFREVLSKIEGIQFYQYFIPEESEKFYEIDFALLSDKIAFEINGNQHYNRNGDLASYYQERHDYLVNLGWKVIEIHYSLCFDEEKIKKIIADALDDDVKFTEKMNSEVINYKIEQKRIKIEEKQKKQEKLLKKKNELDVLKTNRINFINSYIDKNGKHWGWIGEISKQLNISHTQIRRLLKKYNIDV